MVIFKYNNRKLPIKYPSDIFFIPKRKRITDILVYSTNKNKKRKALRKRTRVLMYDPFISGIPNSCINWNQDDSPF